MIRILQAVGVMLGGVLAQGSVQAQVTCTAPEVRVAWPSTSNPVWDMCYVAYANSSGPRGSGLELRRVHYNGRLVLKKANAPILFAEYTGSTCYRDWKDDPEPFLAMPSMRNQIGTLTGASTEFRPTTSCDRSADPVTSYGNCPFGISGRTAADCFDNGVAIENRGDHLVLTAQYQADWYLYTSRFFFFANGSFSPEFGFGNRNGTGNGTTHWHHNYWRLDFDIEGAANDVIAQDGVVQSLEFANLRCNGTTSPACATARTWEVRDTVTGRGFLLTPSSADYVSPTNQSGRNFHTVDVLGTVYKFTTFEEQTDRGNSNTLTQCGFLQNNLADGEDLDGAGGTGADVVLYYRAGARDMSASPGPQDSMVCKSVGPVFTPIGNWSNSEPALFENGFE
jgi:hypothetical protein